MKYFFRLHPLSLSLLLLLGTSASLGGPVFAQALKKEDQKSVTPTIEDTIEDTVEDTPEDIDTSISASCSFPENGITSLSDFHKESILTSLGTLGRRLLHYNLGPQYQLPTSADSQQSLFMSHRFFSDERAFHVVFVQLKDKIFTRFLYLSTSQGTFRILDGLAEGGWIGKGVGEEFMALHPSLQYSLHHYTGAVVTDFTLHPRAPINLEYLFDRGSPAYATYLYKSQCPFWYEFSQKRFKKETKACLLDIQSFIPDHRVSRTSGGMQQDLEAKTLKLQAVTIFNEDLSSIAGYEPDFHKKIKEYSYVSPLYGHMYFIDYFSSNDQVIYSYAYVYDRFVYLSNIAFTEYKLNKWGVQRIMPDSHQHNSPIWEYDFVIPPSAKTGLKHPLLPTYEFNWPTVRSIPLVQDWYRAQDLTLPDPDAKPQ